MRLRSARNLAGGEGGQVGAVPSRMLPAIGVEQADDAAGEGGFAGAALADDAERAAAGEGDADVVERADDAFGAAETGGTCRSSC